MVSSMGISVVLAIGIGVWFGLTLDRWFGTKPWFFYIFLFIFFLWPVFFRLVTFLFTLLTGGSPML